MIKSFLMLNKYQQDSVAMWKGILNGIFSTFNFAHFYYILFQNYLFNKEIREETGLIFNLF